MPRQEERSCCRWTVTMLHVMMCLVGGACILVVMILREGNTECVPTLLDSLGHKQSYENHILDLVCEVMLYSCGVIAGWSILSFFVHCCWEARPCFAMQAVIYVAVGILGLIGSASLSTQFLIWCNDLQTVYPNASDCYEALTYYDIGFPNNHLNLSMHYRTDLIQQGCSWALAATSIFLAFIYVSLMCVTSYDSNTARVIYVRDTETQPLIEVNERTM